LSTATSLVVAAVVVGMRRSKICEGRGRGKCGFLGFF
jgi:hypothetical protein